MKIDFKKAGLNYSDNRGTYLQMVTLLGKSLI